MTFEQAQTKLRSIVNIPRQEYMKDPAGCAVYLERLQFFLDILGNPEKEIPHYIHIAGTSGKGSVTSFLHSMLLADNKRVGMLQSPHPTDIRERWTVGKKIMSKKEFIRIAKVFGTAFDTYMRTSPYEMISFSEMNTAFGLYYFAQQGVDWCVLETACGGRYDSTNIIPYKDIAIITNIGLDHTELLGDTKEKIATAKAGIIKKGSQVFTMESDQAVRAVLEQEATAATTPFHYVSPQYTINTVSLKGTSFTYKGATYTLQTLGEHQVYNAVLTIDVAHAIGLSDRAIQKGLITAVQPIRMEVVGHKPMVILDAAHNEDKITSTVQTLKQLKKEKQHIHLVLGFSENKDITAMLRILQVLEPSSVACTRNTLNEFRKVADPMRLLQAVHEIAPKATTEVFFSPVDAVSWSKKQAKKDDIVLVTGSVFLAGEIRGSL